MTDRQRHWTDRQANDELESLFLLARQEIADVDVSRIQERVMAALCPRWFAEIIRDPLQVFSARSGRHVGVRSAAA